MNSCNETHVIECDRAECFITLEVVGSTPYLCCQVNGPGMALILSKVQSPHQIQGGSSHH